jgi:hypothetical protein
VCIICSTKLLESLEPPQQLWRKNQNFSRLVTIFEGNQPHRDRDHPDKKRQRNGRAVTVTVVPLQLGTVHSFVTMASHVNSCSTWIGYGQGGKNIPAIARALVNS